MLPACKHVDFLKMGTLRLKDPLGAQQTIFTMEDQPHTQKLR